MDAERPRGAMSRFTIALLTLAAALAAPASARGDAGDIIVKHDPGLSGAGRADIRADAGVRLVRTLPLEGTELVHAAPGKRAEALAELRRDPDVVYAQADRRVSATAPNDAYYKLLWGLENTGQSILGQGGAADADIDAPEAWTRSQGAGVVVAVVDTGANAAHEDLAGQIVAGRDFVDGDDDPDDLNGHGSHVTGTIAALGNNATGIAGVAPLAHVMPLRVLDADGSGWDSDVAAAFDYAGDRGVRIVNASLGGPGYSAALADAIAAHPNTLYVVAAGNDHVNNDDPRVADYPCALPLDNVVCVGATDNRDRPASFSNYGASTVDLFAPGVDIASTSMGPATDAYRWMDGTSMASPHVAGAAALALGAYPSASTAQLRAALLSSVDVLGALAGLAVTGGRLNADAAITAMTAPPPPAATPTPTPTPTPTAVATSPPAVSGPAPTPVGTPAPLATPAPQASPILSNLTISGSLRSRRSKLRVGFSLRADARVRFTVTRRGARRPTASWTQARRAGANRLVLTRRLPTRVTLRPGAYVLSVRVATTAGTARFRVG